MSYGGEHELRSTSPYKKKKNTLRISTLKINTENNLS
jgi:hypothetical protein